MADLMHSISWLAPIAAVIGLIMAYVLGSWVLRQDPGNERMQEISGATQEGALAFLKAEYRVLALFVVALFVVLGFAVSWMTGVAFITGALLSATAGFVGMHVATRANSVRRRPRPSVSRRP